MFSPKLIIRCLGLIACATATAFAQSLYFVQEPISRTVQPGGNVTLQAVAGGEPAPVYQWTLNGELIPGATGPELALQNVQGVDAGSYGVIISNGEQTLTSRRADLVVTVPWLPFSDNIARSGRIYGESGIGRGSNVGARAELLEPLGLLRPTHSVWVNWVAPADGSVTFSTAGSGFDTWLAAYQQISILFLNLNLALLPGAVDDDSADYHTSLIQFNVAKGREYLICVDGDAGATGNIVLSWNFVPKTVVPTISSSPASQTVKPGEAVNLSFNYQCAQPATLQWFKNGEVVPGANSTTLRIAAVGEDDVGSYFCRLTVGGREFFTQDAEVQINTEGSKVGARNKLSQSLLSVLGDLTSSLGIRLFATSTTSMGYNGTQVYATSPGKDAEEPNHCGTLGGASFWMTYTAPSTGVLTLTTDGSNYDTILAVYVDDGTARGYDSLVPVACDNNSGADGLDSKVIFDVTAKTTYYIVVDGVNGATGKVCLNYNLNTRPTITAISGFTISEDTASPWKSFSISDKETAVGSLVVTASSSNPNLVPVSNVSFSGSTGSRSLSVRPAPNQNGKATITISVKDANGAVATSSFVVTVNPTNDAPVAQPDYFSTKVEQRIAIYIPSLLGNDSDPDGHTINFYSCTPTTSAGGDAYPYGNYIYYIPPIEFAGTDMFNYTIKDSTGAISTARVTIYVNR